MGLPSKFKFTRTAVDNLPFSQGGNDRPEYRDLELANLVLRVSKTAKTYYLYKRDPNLKGKGGEIKIKLGNHLELTPDEARKRALKYLTTDGGVRQAQVNEGTETFRKLCDLYEELHIKTRLKPTTQKDYRRQIEKHILPLWEDRDPRSVSRGEIRMVFEKRSKEAPAQANKFLVVLSSIYSFALKRDAVEHNPCDRIEVNPPAKRKRKLNDDELTELLNVLVEVEPVKRCFFWLCVLLGQRRTETASLEWKELLNKKGVWTLPPHKTKNGVEHSVPLPPLAQAFINKLRLHTGSMPNAFYSWELRHNREPGPLAPNGLTLFLQRLRKKHMKHREEFRIHDLRRTVATNLGALTKNRDTVKLVLNHKKPDVTDIYDLYAYDDVKLEALTMWEEKVRSLIKPEVLQLSLE